MNIDPEPLLIWLESSTGTRFPLKGHVTLGRSRTNTIPISCEKASRRHALVRLDEEGKCVVMDLGSSNGTHVNGTRITHLAQMQPGDYLEVGTERFTLRAWTGEGEETDAHPAAQFVPCWMILGDREEDTEPANEAGNGDSFKTTISWEQVCENYVERNKATLAGYEGKLFAYWADPQHDPAIATLVAKSLRELQVVQVRQRMEFRMALHTGMVVIGSSGHRRKKELIGTEVTFAFQMQRLAWELSVPCLISEEANRRIAPLIPTHPVDSTNLPSAPQDRRFYSL